MDLTLCPPCPLFLLEVVSQAASRLAQQSRQGHAICAQNPRGVRQTYRQGKALQLGIYRGNARTNSSRASHPAVDRVA